MKAVVEEAGKPTTHAQRWIPKTRTNAEVRLEEAGDRKSVKRSD